MTLSMTVRTEVEIKQMKLSFTDDALVADVSISHKFHMKKFEKVSQALKELKRHESLNNSSNNNDYDVQIKYANVFFTQNVSRHCCCCCCHCWCFY